MRKRRPNVTGRMARLKAETFGMVDAIEYLGNDIGWLSVEVRDLWAAFERLSKHVGATVRRKERPK